MDYQAVRRGLLRPQAVVPPAIRQALDRAASAHAAQAAHSAAVEDSMRRMAALGEAARADGTGGVPPSLIREERSAAILHEALPPVSWRDVWQQVHPDGAAAVGPSSPSHTWAPGEVPSDWEMLDCIARNRGAVRAVLGEWVAARRGFAQWGLELAEPRWTLARRCSATVLFQGAPFERAASIALGAQLHEVDNCAARIAKDLSFPQAPPYNFAAGSPQLVLHDLVVANERWTACVMSDRLVPPGFANAGICFAELHNPMSPFAVVMERGFLPLQLDEDPVRLQAAVD